VPVLSWRECTPADRAALRAFQCTAKPKRVSGHPYRKHHAKRWELDVQSQIRTLTPTCDGRAAVLLGEDEEGLAAVSVVALQEDASASVIEGIAVAERRRNQDGMCADEAIDAAINWAIGRADVAGLERLIVAALTHPLNSAARSLVQRHGFGLFTHTPDADTWQLQIHL
jgi:hypothetical protein